MNAGRFDDVNDRCVEVGMVVDWDPDQQTYTVTYKGEKADGLGAQGNFSCAWLTSKTTPADVTMTEEEAGRARALYQRERSNKGTAPITMADAAVLLRKLQPVNGKQGQLPGWCSGYRYHHYEFGLTKRASSRKGALANSSGLVTQYAQDLTASQLGVRKGSHSTVLLREMGRGKRRGVLWQSAASTVINVTMLSTPPSSQHTTSFSAGWPCGLVRLREVPPPGMCLKIGKEVSSGVIDGGGHLRVRPE